MQTNKYQELYNKVMATAHCTEIMGFVSQYRLEEFDAVQYKALDQHLRACLCRDIISISYNINLTWSEDDVLTLHNVANDLRNSIIVSKTGFKDNLTQKKAAFINICCSVDRIDDINYEKFKTGLDLAINCIGSMLSEIMIIHLGLKLNVNNQNIACLEKKHVSCMPEIRVGKFIMRDPDYTIPSFYTAIKQAIENPSLFNRKMENQMQDPTDGRITMYF